jgi:hypothetical protein
LYKNFEKGIIKAMEHITKQQLILLCLLVAIVTAVATSVATVSLTDGTGRPEQTIYKVIEKTIEKVADIPTVKEIVGNNDAKQNTTVLSPSDIADTKSKSLVRIYELVAGEKKFVALGVAVGKKDGVLASPLLTPINMTGQYVAMTSNNLEVAVRYEKGDIVSGFSLFTLLYDPKEKTKVIPLALKNITGLKLGTNVLSLGGKESGDVLSTGIVTEIRAIDKTTASTTKNMVVTDMNLTTNISGWLLFDTVGNLVAFEKGFDEADKMPIFINAKLVEDAMINLL